MADADALLAIAVEIERRDGDVAAALEVVLDLAARSDEIRARAAQLQLLLEGVPREIAALDRNEAEARDRLANAAGALADAERRVAELVQRRSGNAVARATAEPDLVRSQLEGERDRLVREANELGGAVLGEQLAGSNIALVRRRLEEALRP